MSAVRIDSEAFSDARLELLGHLLGTSRYDALGRLAYLWHWCTRQQRHLMPESLVRVIVNPDHLVDSGLGERVENGEIRIKGTRGRIEWLTKLKDNAKKGGGQTKANWLTKRSDVATPSAVANSRSDEGPLTLTSSLTLSPSSSPSVEHPPSEERAPSTRARRKSPEVTLPADWEPTDEHRKLAAERGVNLQNQARAFRAHAETHDRRCVRWNSAFTTWLLKARPESASGDGLAHVLRIANGEIP